MLLGPVINLLHPFYCELCVSLSFQLLAKKLLFLTIPLLHLLRAKDMIIQASKHCKQNCTLFATGTRAECSSVYRWLGGKPQSPSIGYHFQNLFAATFKRICKDCCNETLWQNLVMSTSAPFPTCSRFVDSRCECF